MATKPAIMSGDFYQEGYRLPDKKKQFMKFEVGDNHFRILSAPLMGFVHFNNENKPVRKLFVDGDFSEEEMKQNKAKKDADSGNYEGSRHFWALIVWSYNHSAPKILEITQSTIMKAIDSHVKDQDWGDPRAYDIVVTRTGTGKTDTEFSLRAKPKKELSKDISDIVIELENKCNLNALMSGDYPFKNYDFDNG